MLGTVVNTAAIIIGGAAGLIFRKGIPKRINNTMLNAMGLAVLLIGFKGALQADDPIVVIICLAAGTVIGELCGIEERLQNLGNRIEKLMAASGQGVAKGFVNGSLLYCVGAMAIVGSLESGLAGNNQILFAKSIIDGVASLIFASTMGVGILLSSVSVFIYQGTITLGASFVESLLVPEVVTNMSSVGGLLIVGLGFNMMDIKQIPVANMLPAVFIPIVYHMVKILI